VYAGVFETLAQQEADAWRRSDAAGAPNADPPAFAPFGGPECPAADVSAFYSCWAGFTTHKEFSWADLWNLASADNRQVRAPARACGRACTRLGACA
jgi:hypothetical protein